MLHQRDQTERPQYQEQHHLAQTDRPQHQEQKRLQTIRPQNQDQQQEQPRHVQQVKKQVGYNGEYAGNGHAQYDKFNKFGEYGSENR